MGQWDLSEMYTKPYAFNIDCTETAKQRPLILFDRFPFSANLCKGIRSV